MTGAGAATRSQSRVILLVVVTRCDNLSLRELSPYYYWIIIDRNDPDRAARAPHAVHPAAPGALAPGAGEHCATTTLYALYLAWTC